MCVVPADLQLHAQSHCRLHPDRGLHQDISFSHFVSVSLSFSWVSRELLPSLLPGLLSSVFLRKEGVRGGLTRESNSFQKLKLTCVHLPDLQTILTV